jgi:hypothetical protein
VAHSPSGLGLPLPFKGFLRRHSHAYRFLSGRVGRLRESWRGRRWRTGVPDFSPFQQEAFCVRRYPPEFDLAWTRAESDLGRIKSWCDSNRARLAIVAIPTRAQVYPDHWDAVRRRFDLRDDDFDLEKPQRILSAFAARSGIPLIDVRPALRAARDTGPPLYFETDIHWTPRGHEVAAEEIVRQLRALGLVPAS